MPRSDQAWEAEFWQKSALYRPFDALFERLGPPAGWPSLHDYTRLVEERRQSLAPELEALEFRAPVQRPRRSPRPTPIRLADLYDGSIALERRVPCLPASYHDFFNVLIWAAFPRAKRALHARQYRALTEWVDLALDRLPSKRTREQDALTVFDEGGSVIAMTRACHARWQSLGVGELLSAEHGEATPVLFGHALLEHVLYRRPQVRSAAMIVVFELPLPSGVALLDTLDEQLARSLCDPECFTAPGVDTVLQIDTSGSALVRGMS